MSNDEIGKREYNTYVSCKKYIKWYMLFRIVGIILVMVGGFTIIGLVGRVDTDAFAGVIKSQVWYIKYMLIGIVIGFVGFASYCFGTEGYKRCVKIINRAENKRK